MTSRTAWSAESRDSLAALAESAAAFAVSMAAAAEHGNPLGPDPSGSTDPSGGTDPSGSTDPLFEVADMCLDALTEVARFEARAAALKVLLTAGFVHAAGALAPPARSAQEHSAQAMAVIAEIACALTVSEGTAAALVSQSQALTTALPRTLAALQTGTISWQHARIVVDETAHLDAAGAAGLEEHFLDPGAPKPARGCPAGELVPGRFRAKAR
ncbi:DUF222 domain-containing protein, partial [Arthrobacter sp. MP_2.3]|uniref:DUF222 domain-containing protein n=1 Tax=Arthrobacter sp. MP_2.3 TaxID=3349633 RepID=UPI0038D40E0C